MTRDVTLSSINPENLIEVIPSRDPDYDIRFAMPVPDYLSHSCGEDLKKRYWFIDEYRKSDQSVQIRLKFKNFKDDCFQGVRINGEGSIVFMGKGFNTYKKIMRGLNENYRDIEKISLKDVSSILTQTRVQFGITDRYNKTISEINKKMDRVPGLESTTPGYGGFFYKPIISSALFLDGKGSYKNGPTATPQIFQEGAFLVFPEQRKVNVIKALAENCHDMKAKIVQKDVFLKTRHLADGTRVNI